MKAGWFLIVVVGLVACSTSEPARHETPRVEPTPQEAEVDPEEANRRLVEAMVRETRARQWRERQEQRAREAKEARERAERDRMEAVARAKEQSEKREREWRAEQLKWKSQKLVRDEEDRWRIRSGSRGNDWFFGEFKTDYLRLRDLHVAQVHLDEQRLLRVRIERRAREVTEWKVEEEVARKVYRRLSDYDVDRDGTVTRETLAAKVSAYENEARVEARAEEADAREGSERFLKFLVQQLEAPPAWSELLKRLRVHMGVQSDEAK